MVDEHIEKFRAAYVDKKLPSWSTLLDIMHDPESKAYMLEHTGWEEDFAKRYIKAAWVFETFPDNWTEIDLLLSWGDSIDLVILCAEHLLRDEKNVTTEKAILFNLQAVRQMNKGEENNTSMYNAF
ncbi:MAG: hypothetical protein AAGM67_00260, partial [Bacteroidota bacterium]